MSNLRILSIAAILAGGLSGFAAGSANADVATRCDWRGCVHIACNWTGDRCHRLYGDDYYGEGRYRGSYYPRRYRNGYDRGGYDYDRYRYRDYDYGNDDDGGYRESYRGWRYDCDNDADSCYIRRSWNGS